MPTEVTLPQLGESVTEGTITKWLVREGDVVKKDQALVTVATDKADAEVPAPVAGRVSRILAAEGQTVPVKAPLCHIEEGVTQPSSAAVSSAPAKTPASPASQPAPAAAATPAAASPLAPPSARTAALEHGVYLGAVQGSGERGRITRDDVMRAAGDKPATAGLPASAQTAASGQPVAGATPPARAAQLAQMINQGGGWTPPVPGLGYGAFKVPAYRPNEGDKVIPFTRRRRITADHMTYSKIASPHVVTVAEVDLFKAARLREAHKERYKKEGLGLTMLAFLVAATARALRENEALNARVLDDAYVIFKDVNIGVAVDSPEGLVVPVVRRADELGVRGVVRVVDDLAKRAKTGKITIDDLSGATFSVSNPGLKGNLFGGAIINQPNVGILRMGEIQKRVVVVEGPDGEDQMAIHPVMYVALSYDHRIVDGVAATAFLWRVTELLEKAESEV